MRPERNGLPTNAGKACVAQLHTAFFEKSETFIYQYATHLRQFHPVFLAQRFVNQDQFPLPPDDCRPLSAPRGTWNWFWQALGRRVLGRELPAERFLKRRQARLLHAHFGPNGVWALGLKRPLRIPLVTTFYGYDMSQASVLSARKEGYQALFREGDLFLVEGPHMRSRLISLGCPSEKTAIQRIALPLDRIAFRPRKAKKREETVVLLFSGRFVEKKGILRALDVVADIRKNQPRIEFRIIGDGPLKARVSETISRNGMGEFTKLLGFLRYDELIREMNLADIFISPSQTAADGDSEGGAPTSILEAQALGMPVISTVHADIPHIVDAGRSALLSAEGDGVGLRRDLLRLLENREMWAAMGAAGREWVESRHDVRKEAVGLEEKYALLIAQNGGGGKR